jgi:hypothetical protein
LVLVEPSQAREALLWRFDGIRRGNFMGFWTEDSAGSGVTPIDPFRN